MEILLLIVVFCAAAWFGEWASCRIKGVDRVEVPRGWGNWVKEVVAQELKSSTHREP